MAERNLSWLDDIEIEDLLTGDLQLVHMYCGKEVLKKLWQAVPSIAIYVSTKPLDRAKKHYIKKHFNGHNVKELCLLLDVSERFVYNTLEERNELQKQSSLFEPAK